MQFTGSDCGTRTWCHRGVQGDLGIQVKDGRRPFMQFVTLKKKQKQMQKTWGPVISIAQNIMRISFCLVKFSSSSIDFVKQPLNLKKEM